VSNWNSRVLDTRSLGSWLCLLTFPESRIFSRIKLPRIKLLNPGFEFILGSSWDRSRTVLKSTREDVIPESGYWKRCETSGKVNCYWQFPRNRISSRKQFPRRVVHSVVWDNYRKRRDSRELITRKDVRSRELTITFNFSRGLASLPVNSLEKLL
jgi:hypothetical protein